MTNNNSPTDIKFTCFCGGEILLHKTIGSNTHFKCKEDQHFSFSVSNKGTLEAVSARISDGNSLHWYKEMEFARLIFENQKKDNSQIISNMSDLMLFVENPIVYIQNHLILV